MKRYVESPENYWDEKYIVHVKTISELTMLPHVNAFELMYLIHALTVHDSSNFRPKMGVQIRIVESTM